MEVSKVWEKGIKWPGGRLTWQTVFQVRWAFQDESFQFSFYSSHAVKLKFKWQLFQDKRQLMVNQKNWLQTSNNRICIPFIQYSEHPIVTFHNKPTHHQKVQSPPFFRTNWTEGQPRTDSKCSEEMRRRRRRPLPPPASAAWGGPRPAHRRRHFDTLPPHPKFPCCHPPPYMWIEGTSVSVHQALSGHPGHAGETKRCFLHTSFAQLLQNNNSSV